MTEEQAKKLGDLHEFLFGTVPGISTSKSRAEQIEEILRAYRAGSFFVRAVLWGAGVVTAVGAALIALRGNGG